MTTSSLRFTLARKLSVSLTGRKNFPPSLGACSLEIGPSWWRTSAHRFPKLARTDSEKGKKACRCVSSKAAFPASRPHASTLGGCLPPFFLDLRSWWPALVVVHLICCLGPRHAFVHSESTPPVGVQESARMHSTTLMLPS